MAEWITANVSVPSIIHQSELLYYISLANEGLRVFIVSNTFIIRSFELYVCLLNRCFYSLTLRREEDSRVHKRARASRKEVEGWRKPEKDTTDAVTCEERIERTKSTSITRLRAESLLVSPLFSDEILWMKHYVYLNILRYVLKTCNNKIVWCFCAQSLPSVPSRYDWKICHKFAVCLLFYAILSFTHGNTSFKKINMETFINLRKMTEKHTDWWMYAL